MHKHHDDGLTAGLAAGCGRCRELALGGEALSPGFDDRGEVLADALRLAQEAYNLLERAECAAWEASGLSARDWNRSPLSERMAEGLSALDALLVSAAIDGPGYSSGARAVAHAQRDYLRTLPEAERVAV